MPSKIQLDENLWFLYICLQKSDMKAIDFNAVAAATSLKPPAARMRYTRLKRQIESGTLIGTHGIPFSEPSSASKKRNRVDHEGKRDDGEDEEEIRKPKKERERIAGVKKEQGLDWSEDEKFSGDNWSDNAGEESEDEVPLAKLRKRKLMPHAFVHQDPSSQPAQGMEIPRFLPPLEMMGHQGYGTGVGVGPHDSPVPVQRVVGGQWVDYDEAARAWQRARDWHLEHVHGR